MPVSRLDAEALRRVLQDLGSRLQWPTEVEIVLIGSAAGILTGELERRLTSDCDVPLHVPKEAWQEIRRRVVEIARERQLSKAGSMPTYEACQDGCLRAGGHGRRRSVGMA